MAVFKLVLGHGEELSRTDPKVQVVQAWQGNGPVGGNKKQTHAFAWMLLLQPRALGFF